MKEKILFFTLLIVGFAFSSCDKSDFEYEDNFKKSRSAWLDFKDKSNNTYKYTTQGSTWVGYTWETTIMVAGGKVTGRSFKYTSGENIPEKDLAWTENELEINTHSNTPASEAVTLDVIYEKAEQDWLKKRKDVETFFEANNNGMISLCGYTPNGCMDDCFRGIQVLKIEAQNSLNYN